MALTARWARAQAKLDVALLATGMTARIHHVKDFDCSVTFETNGREYIKENVDIATFEDEPSPELVRLVGNAKIALGLA